VLVTTGLGSRIGDAPQAREKGLPTVPEKASLPDCHSAVNLFRDLCESPTEKSRGQKYRDSAVYSSYLVGIRIHLSAVGCYED